MKTAKPPAHTICASSQSDSSVLHSASSVFGVCMCVCVLSSHQKDTDVGRNLGTNVSRTPEEPIGKDAMYQHINNRITTEPGALVARTHELMGFGSE